MIDLLQRLAHANAADIFVERNLIATRSLASADLTVLDLAVRLHLMRPLSHQTVRFVHLLVRDYFAFARAMSLVNESAMPIRRAAVDVLGELRDPRAIPVLIEALHDQNARRVRRAAANALIKMGPASVESLMAALKDPDEDVRQHAAVALGELADSRARDALWEAASDQSKMVRRRVIEALTAMPDPENFPIFVHLLNDTDPDVRRRAATAVVGLKNPAAYACDCTFERSEHSGAHGCDSRTRVATEPSGA